MRPDPFITFKSKYEFNHHSHVGLFLRHRVAGPIGRRLLWFAQRLLRWSLRYCSVCGRNYGMSGCISRFGGRCHDKECWQVPAYIHGRYEIPGEALKGGGE